MEEGGAVEYQKSAVSYQEFSFCRRISQSQSTMFWDVCKSRTAGSPGSPKTQAGNEWAIMHVQ